MADSPQLPMTVDAAKQHLRETANAMSVSQYVKHHPYQSLGMAFVIGMLLADNRRAETLLLGSRLLDTLRPLFLNDG